MALKEVKTALQTALSSKLSGWEVATSAIPFARDLLVEVVWLDTTTEMIEMSSVAVRGNLGVVLYRKFGEDYDMMIDAIEDIAELLPTLNISGVAIGNQTPILANVSSPSVTSDGRNDFRVIVVAIPVEVML